MTTGDRSRILAAGGVLVCCAFVVLVLAVTKKESRASVAVTVTRLQLPVENGRTLNLLRSVHLRSMVLSNFDSLTLEGGSITFTHPGGPPPRSKNPRITSIAAGKPFSSITVENVSLQSVDQEMPGNVVISFSKYAPNSLKVTFDNRVKLRLAGSPPIRGACDACMRSGDAASQRDTHGEFVISSDQGVAGQAVKAASVRKPSVIGLELASLDQLDTQGFALDSGVRFESVQDGQSVSSILTGSVQFPEYKERVIDLAAGDFLRMATCRDMHLHSLTISNGLHLTLTSECSDLRVGLGKTLRNRVPSWLEWFDEKQPVPLYLGGVTALVGLVWGVLKILNFVKEAKK